MELHLPSWSALVGKKCRDARGRGFEPGWTELCLYYPPLSQGVKGEVHWFPVEVFLSPLSLLRPCSSGMGLDSPRWGPWGVCRPSDFGGIDPKHGAVEVPPRSLFPFPAFGLANWSREAVHFVRVSRDVYGDFQSLHVRLKFVPMFREDRLEQVWNLVGRSFTVGEFQEGEVVFRTGRVARADTEGR